MEPLIKKIPNTLSLSRWGLGLLVFYFLMIKQYAPAFVLFLLAATTDALDGAIARKYNARSAIGYKYMDIIGDILLLVLGVIAIIWILKPSINTFLGISVLAIIYFLTVRKIRSKHFQTFLRFFLEKILYGVIMACITIFIAAQLGIEFILIGLGYLGLLLYFKRKWIFYNLSIYLRSNKSIEEEKKLIQN